MSGRSLEDALRSAESAAPAKYIDLPLSNYSTWPNDKVASATDQADVRQGGALPTTSRKSDSKR